MATALPRHPRVKKHRHSADKVTKYVTSGTLSGPVDWNATLIEGDVAEAVRRLRDLYEAIDSHGYGELAAANVAAPYCSHLMVRAELSR